MILKGDQASIIGGVIEFIKELHQVLQSLEAKKRRMSLSPSPGPPGPSPRPVLLQLSPNSESSLGGHDKFKEVGTCCNSPVADVEAKISGSNVILRTVSKRIPGQLSRIISVLEKFSFEILHLNISSMEDTVLYSFVIKVYVLYIYSYSDHPISRAVLAMQKLIARRYTVEGKIISKIYMVNHLALFSKDLSHVLLADSVGMTLFRKQ